MVDITSNKLNIAQKIIAVNITPGFLLLMTAFTVLAGPGRALMAFVCVTVHELGHLAALAIWGAHVTQICFGLGGGEIKYTGTLSYAGEALTALSGPFAGALLAALSLGVGEVAGFGWCYELAAVSLMYTFLNLIPVSPTDGGRTLRALLALAFGPDVSDRICRAADIACGAAVFAAGVYALFVSRGNVTPLICAVFLLNACCKKARFGVK